MARSKLEEDLDRALSEVFGPAAIKHDMTIKVRGTSLYVDRVLPIYKVAFEADGRQHSEFVLWMHGDKQGFEDSKRRDSMKERWLADNGYVLVRFRFDEKITSELVKLRLKEALSEDASL